MKYSGKKDYPHSSLEKTGLLITNLGTPEAPTAKALRKYLAEFLWDPRVVEIPRPIWWLVLNLIILRIRPKRSAAVYEKIWTDQGSPLMSHTLDQMEGIKQQLKARGLEHIEVECAMRY
jgi:ferrochelatase